MHQRHLFVGEVLCGPRRLRAASPRPFRASSLSPVRASEALGVWRPTVAPMTRTETVAVTVAIISASVTVVGLIWQLALYKLSGARLQVRLRPAVLDDLGTLYRGPEHARWSLSNAPGTLLQRPSPRHIDLAEVRVTNIGRAAVSVSDVELDLGVTEWRWWKRHTVRPKPFAAWGATADEVLRLDVGESRTILFDVWSLLHHPMSRRGMGDLTLRASAKPAGRRTRRSPWRRRWRYPAERRTLLLDIDASPELEAYRALWHETRGSDGPPTSFLAAWIALQRVMGSAEPSEDAFRDALEPELGPAVNWTAHTVWSAFAGAARRQADRRGPSDFGNSEGGQP